MRTYKIKDLEINLDSISAISEPYLDSYYKIHKYQVYLPGVVKDFTCKDTKEYEKLMAAWKGEAEIKQARKRGGGKK